MKNKEIKYINRCIDKRVIFFCKNYIYEGLLIEVTSDEVILQDSRIIYKVGKTYDLTRYKISERMGTDKLAIMLNCIECFCLPDENPKRKDIDNNYYDSEGYGI